MLTHGGKCAFGMLLGLAALAGCKVSTDLPGGARVTCSTDAECPAQTHCEAALQRCVRDGNGDGTPAELVTARVVPAVATPGTLVELTFQTNEALGVSPSAWLTRGEVRLPMALFEFAGAAGVFRYAVTGEEAEGEWLVQVAAVDAVGNTATLNAGTVQLDVHGPSIADVAWRDAGSGVGTTSLPRVTARVSAPARIVGAVAVVDGQPRLGLAATLRPTLDPAWLDLSASVSVAELGLTGTGTLRVELTVADLAGNETTAATSELPYDVVAPETTISAAPAQTSYDVDVSIAFGGSAGTASFACSLDGAPAAPCASPLALTDLSLGAHTFSVAAADAEGNPDLTPAVAAWTIARSWGAFSAGQRHTCALGSDDRLFCWGDNATAQLGRGSALTAAAAGDPGRVASAQERFRSVSAGKGHSCAVGRDGSLWCWGANDFGQLGIGTVTAFKEAPVRVGTATDWLLVAAGFEHTCGLRGSPAGAELHCWGHNTSGALGLGAAAPAGAVRPAPVRVGTESDWQALAVSNNHACGVREDGGARTAWCWGTLASATAPVRQTGPSGLDGITAGLNHACGLTSAGALWCWGSNA
ncbi:MAG: hypothetical protein QM704_25520 [Anaeromyxobacteraceae bacterium]